MFIASVGLLGDGRGMLIETSPGHHGLLTLPPKILREGEIGGSVMIAALHGLKVLLLGLVKSAAALIHTVHLAVSDQALLFCRAHLPSNVVIAIDRQSDELVGSCVDYRVRTCIIDHFIDLPLSDIMTFNGWLFYCGRGFGIECLR